MTTRPHFTCARCGAKKETVRGLCGACGRFGTAAGHCGRCSAALPHHETWCLAERTSAPPAI